MAEMVGGWQMALAVRWSRCPRRAVDCWLVGPPAVALVLALKVTLLVILLRGAIVDSAGAFEEG